MIRSFRQAVIPGPSGGIFSTCELHTMNYPTTEAEAVLFFSGKALERELLYSEFEAVLDGFVPLPEQAGHTVTAVYLRVTHGYRANAAVFFTLEFDSRGFPDRRWNTPLEQLADAAAAGPDLGAGPIRLACRSQCPIVWYEQQLWDPQMTPDCNHFALIKKTLKRNRLGLLLSDREPLAEQPQDTSAIQEQLRQRMAQAIKEQRLRVATLQEQHRQALQQLERDSMAAAQQHLQHIDQLSQELAEARSKGAQLEQDNERLSLKINGLRDYFEHKLSHMKSLDDASLAAMQDRLEQEKQAELVAVSEYLTEQLQIRDIEVMYRDTRIAGLEDEVERLQQERQQLLRSSGSQLLEQLHNAGINFVTFQPGAGHLTLPLDDIASFMLDPEAYAARRCQIAPAVFKAWREHYHQPRCTAADDTGPICGGPVDRCERPAEFLPGVSNRCPVHAVSAELRPGVVAQ